MFHSCWLVKFYVGVVKSIFLAPADALSLVVLEVRFLWLCLRLYCIARSIIKTAIHKYSGRDSVIFMQADLQLAAAAFAIKHIVDLNCSINRLQGLLR